MLTVGGLHHERDHPMWDPESNVLFLVRTVCDVCSNSQFFDSEFLQPDSEKSLVRGMTLDEELAAEEAGTL